MLENEAIFGKDQDPENMRNWASLMQDKKSSLMEKFALIALDLDFLKDPEKALTQRIELTKNAKHRSRWEQRLSNYQYYLYLNVLIEVAEETGGDLAQISDPKKRTPEQHKALMEAYARRELNRMDLFFKSDYMQALYTLDKIDTPFSDPEDSNAISVKESFVLYYFTTRPDIRPSSSGHLTESDKEDLITRYKRFTSFIIEYFGTANNAESARNEEWQAALEAFIKVENPAEAQEIIENLSSVLPQKHVIPINKLSNTLTKGIINIGKVTLDVSRSGSKKPVETTCILTYEGDKVQLFGRHPFTEYDRNVYNAVTSLYVYGDPSHVVTPAMVFRAMTGLTDTEKPTAQQIESITESLDKMRFIRARIDCTEELKAHRVTLNSKQINGGTIDTYLLMADAVIVNAGGHIVSAYQIMKTPILYEYAAALKQVLTLPASMLDVKELDSTGKPTTRSLSNTETRIQIKGYLLRRIEGLKSKSLNNPTITLYDYDKDGETHKGLYSIAGKPEAKDLEAKRIRTDIEKMLSYWKATAYIKDFEIRMQRRKIVGYKIIV